MFTGLVEGVGEVASIISEEAGIRLEILAPDSMLELSDPVQLGESVAINGCCLTVVSHDGSHWEFQAGSETLSKTNLGGLAVGSAVNLERAMKMNARLGGHIVQGHIDGLATVRSIVTEGDWTFLSFHLAPELTRMMVSKGSVTVDGVSLTVVDPDVETFRVALIPHTLEQTTLGQRQVGDRVNIEVDILGKYVARLLDAAMKG